MANFELIAQQYPSGGALQKLIFVDNGDGTFTLTIASSDGTFPSLASSIAAGSNVKVFGIVGGAGGANTQLQYNNSGNLGGISGATTDGTVVTFATNDIKITNLIDAGSGHPVFQASGALFSSNVFIGENAGTARTTGTRNVGIGDIAEVSLQGGSSNTAVGASALASNTGGNQNTAIGDSALSNGTTGNNNVAVGYDSLMVATADANTAVGHMSLTSLTSGVRNVALGFHSGLNTNGNDNTLLGYNTGPQVSLGNGNVFIGSQAGSAAGAVSNKLFIANSNTSTPLIGGDFSALTLTFGGILNFITGLGNVNQISGPTDQPLQIVAPAPVQVAASVAGNAVSLNASNATAGSSVNGAAAGGSFTITAGNAARLVSGNANGGNITLNPGTGIGTGSTGVVALGGQLNLVTGTTAIAPLSFTAGTNLTTATAGAVEFDGVQFYETIDTTSGRGATPVEQYFHLTANGSAITTIANFFGATSNISLVANAHYEIEMWLWMVTTGTGAVTITLTNSAAPTSQNIYWEESPATGVVAPPGTATQLFGQTLNDTTAAKAIATASLSAATHLIHIRIWLINGAGTSLKIQATAGGTNLTPQIGSWWKATRRSPSNIGTFAA